MTFPTTHLRSLSRSRVLAALMAVTVFGLGLLTVAPNLHRDVHADAGQVTHGCAVTLFAGGITAAVAALILTFEPLVLARVILPAFVEVPRQTPRLLPPGRAPPVGLSS